MSAKTNAKMPAIVKPKTPSEATADKVTGLLRARNAIIWIVTREEKRVEELLIEAISTAGFLPYTWDVDEGVTTNPQQPPQASLAALVATLGEIKKYSMVAEPPMHPDGTPLVGSDPRKRVVWIMRDLPPWIAGNGGALALRKLRNLARRLPRTPREVAQAIIVLTPHSDIPPELSDGTVVIKWPMPNRAEIAKIFEDSVAGDPNLKYTSATKQAAIDAAVGLSGEEAMACFAQTMTRKRIVPRVIAQEKKRIVERNGLIQWFDPLPAGLDGVGGLGAMKSWLNQRKLAFTESAKQYGLPPPKGMMLVGISGCGKSLTAKATATAFERPLLRLDLGAMKGGTVGKSESNLRAAIETIEAVGRCVVWLDEVEKALAGAINGGRDSGVSADQLGTLLHWMEERKSEAFIIATANDIQAIADNCPEMLRAGRFDVIFFVDLPTAEERAEVLATALRAHKRGATKIDVRKVVEATDKFTGAEIAGLVPSAMFTAFADDARELTTADLVAAAKEVVPLSKTAGPKIRALREWADAGNARRATQIVAKGIVTQTQAEARRRQVDVDETEIEEEEAD